MDAFDLRAFGLLLMVAGALLAVTLAMVQP